ncbi:glycosyltransferase [Thermodesulfobacteriota bacterium]
MQDVFYINKELKAKYPGVKFVEIKYGEELARYYAAADVFVFPSLTDTFGLVMLEALASGVPVATYPVTGPLDLLEKSDVGVLDKDLARAVVEALSISPQRCRDYALKYSWGRVTDFFLGYLAQITS